MKQEKRYCCICGKELKGWGNNPHPVRQEGECCYECNVKYVIPQRILSINSIIKTTKDNK